MKKKITAACLAAGVIVALMSVTATASAQASVGAGLWPDDYQATGQDCGGFGPADANGFCFIDDGGSVELGVKFTVARTLNLVGVRAYRTDSGPVTGSLWDAAGNRLAGPASFTGTATHSWQDATFSSPVTLTPGQTYIASYFAPNADYAFEWDRFTSSSYTVGPITAQQSVVGDGNGVFTYGGTSAFPTSTFRDTNYWVTPLVVENQPPVADAGPDQTVDSEQAGVSLDGSGSSDPDGDPLTYSWTQTAGPTVALSGAGTATPSFDAPVGPATLEFELTVDDGELDDADTVVVRVSYDFTGFYQPVDNGEWNGAKAGRAIPVKFSLGGDQGLEIINDGFPKATPIQCPNSSTPVDPIEETVTAGGSSLSYDASADQYVYSWKTKKSWADKCYRFELGLNDGTSHTFDVQFK